MIKNFSDHAANERTFLAWVRTAIAVMAFGFLIERLDLVLRLAIKAVGGDVPVRSHGSDIAGLIFIALGILMMIVSTVRYVHDAKEIDRELEQHYKTDRIDLAFIGLIVLLSASACLFLYRAFMAL